MADCRRIARWVLALTTSGGERLAEARTGKNPTAPVGLIAAAVGIRPARGVRGRERRRAAVPRPGDALGGRRPGVSKGLLPRAARWAASRPSCWSGRRTSPPLPICWAGRSTRCTKGDLRPRDGRMGLDANRRRRRRCASITEKQRVLASRASNPAVRPGTEALAIEFGCGGTSRDGGSGPTGSGIRGKSD
jgi:hypothetical protein